LVGSSMILELAFVILKSELYVFYMWFAEECFQSSWCLIDVFWILMLREDI